MGGAVQWGSVATWVASIGTVAAVTLALWQAWRERRARFRQELMQQAGRVSAWYAGLHEDSEEEHPDEDPNGADVNGANVNGAGSDHPPLPASRLSGRAADVELLNNSEEPVYDVVVFLSLATYKTKRWWDQEPYYRAMIGVLPPGRWTISVPNSGAVVAWASSQATPAAARVMVVMSFTDSGGNHWARGARGELRQLNIAPIEYWKVHRQDIDWQVPARLN